MPQHFGQVRSRLMQLPCGVGVHLDIIDGYINDRYQAILAAFPWTRLRIESAIQAVAAYTTGTIAVSTASQTLTGTSTVWTAAMNDRWIRIAGRPELYRFTYVSATSATIDQPYEGTTAETAATYSIFQNTFALTEPLEEIESIKNPRLYSDLDMVSTEFLDEIDPSRTNDFAQPYWYAPYQDSTGFIRQVEIYPAPNTAEAYPVIGKRGVVRMTEPQDQFLQWVSVEAIFAGAEADLLAMKGDLNGTQIKEAKYQSLLMDMKAKDARRMPVGQLQPEDRITQHRRDRVTRRYGRAAYRNWNAE